MKGILGYMVIYHKRIECIKGTLGCNSGTLAIYMLQACSSCIAIILGI